MFCAKCGAANDDNAHKCIACGAVMLRAEPGPRLPIGAYLGFSIAVSLLCCLPPGLVGVVFSAMALSKQASGEYDLAAAYLRRAKRWTWAGFGLGAVIWTVYLVLAVLAAVAPKSP